MGIFRLFYRHTMVVTSQKFYLGISTTRMHQIANTVINQFTAACFT